MKRDSGGKGGMRAMWDEMKSRTQAEGGRISDPATGHIVWTANSNSSGVSSNTSGLSSQSSGGSASASQNSKESIAGQSAVRVQGTSAASSTGPIPAIRVDRSGYPLSSLTHPAQGVTAGFTTGPGYLLGDLPHLPQRATALMTTGPGRPPGNLASPAQGASAGSNPFCFTAPALGGPASLPLRVMRAGDSTLLFVDGPQSSANSAGPLEPESNRGTTREVMSTCLSQSRLTPQHSFNDSAPSSDSIETTEWPSAIVASISELTADQPCAPESAVLPAQVQGACHMEAAQTNESAPQASAADAAEEGAHALPNRKHRPPKPKRVKGKLLADMLFKAQFGSDALHEEAQRKFLDETRNDPSLYEYAHSVLQRMNAEAHDLENCGGDPSLLAVHPVRFSRSSHLGKSKACDSDL